MLRLLLATLFLATAAALTCYNGHKILNGGSTGETTEDCGSGAFCYNMSAQVAVFVDLMKAGCSRWRCMLAQDSCIGMNFQGIPVHFCCCSTDRCNVGAYSHMAGHNWNNNNNGPGGANWNNNNNDNNNGGNSGNWNGNGNNNNNNNNDNTGGQGANWGTRDSDASSGFNFKDRSGDGQTRSMQRSPSREDVEKAFKMHIDSPTEAPRGGFGGEEPIQKIDVRKTTPRPMRTQSGAEVELKI
ncbi:unnamed protein product, partial [Mesorhabditis spiculigera]